MIYLDYAATTSMSDSSIEVYHKVAKNYFGNAGSLHDPGSSASRILEKFREVIAGSIHGEPRGIYITGSGSEANQLAIRSLIKAHGKPGGHLVTTRAEHSSVRYLFNHLEKEGYEVAYVPLNAHGRVEMEELKGVLRDDTILASIHHANPEIGTIQDIEAIGRLLDEKGILFHSDCVQSFGKLPVDVGQARLDSISISGHKIYGPKGIGVAYIKPEVRWKPVIPGTTQERGFRPGTVDVPAAAAMMQAVEDITMDMQAEAKREEELRERLLGYLADSGFDMVVEGDPKHRLSNILGVRFPGIEGQYMMIECNRLGLAISTGSACAVGTEQPAASMTALGYDEEAARSFIRLSFGKPTTVDEIDRSAEILENVLTQHFNMVNL